MILERRNVRRSHRMSESNAFPIQNAQPTLVHHRRASVGSSNRFPSRNSIDGANQHPVTDPIVPFDENFVQRINMVIDEGNYSIRPSVKLEKYNLKHAKHDENAFFRLDILLKTPEPTNGIELDDANEIDEGNYELIYLIFQF